MVSALFVDEYTAGNTYFGSIVLSDQFILNLRLPDNVGIFRIARLYWSYKAERGVR